MKNLKWFSLFALLLLVSVSPAFSQFDLFDQAVDWGPADKALGELTDDGSGEIFGTGDGIGGTEDSGFYGFAEKEGSWMLQGRFEWFDPGFDNNSKLGLMIRENPEADDSRFYYFYLQGEAFGDETFAQWRLQEGGNTELTEVFENSDTFDDLEADVDIWYRVMRFAESGRFMSEWSRDAETWTRGHSILVPYWQDTAGFGVAITSNTDDNFLVIGISDNLEFNKIPYEAQRTIPTDEFIPGSPISGIQIDVTIAEGETPDVDITETPPEGWEISNVQATDGDTEVVDGNIVWTISGASGNPALTYDVTPPSEATSGEWSGSFTSGDFEFDMTRPILTSSDKISVYFVGGSQDEAELQRNTVYLDILEEGLTLLGFDNQEVTIPGLGFEAEFINHDIDDPAVARNFDLVIVHEAVSSNAAARYIDLPVPYLAIEQVLAAGRADREGSIWFGPQSAVSTPGGDFGITIIDNSHPITDFYDQDEFVDITFNDAGQLSGVQIDDLAPVAQPLAVGSDGTRVVLAVAEEGETGLKGNEGLTPPPGSEPLPARRGYLGYHENVQVFDTAAEGIENIALTPDGVILFQRVVQWMVGLEPTADGTEEGVPVKEWMLY